MWIRILPTADASCQSCGCGKSRLEFSDVGYAKAVRASESLLEMPSCYSPLVDLTEAIDSMARILNEERQRPTVGYSDNWSDLKARLGGQPFANSALMDVYTRPNIAAMREQKLRLVSEKPQIYSFGGSNYETLQLLFDQVNKADRDEFISQLLIFVENGGFYSRTTTPHFPRFQGCVSDLPMVAEFCIRNGYAERLFSAAAKSKVPTPALALMMMQLEETLALNFTLFSKEQLKNLPNWLEPLRKMADLQTHSARGPRGGPVVKNPHYQPGREKEASQIVDSIDGITAESQQAIFFYIKSSLQQAKSFDVESDKVKVSGYLQSLGFNPMLQQALDQAEKEFRDDATGFQLKTCMSHLRSFLEQLHLQACSAIAPDTTPVTEYNKWGLTVAFLKKHGFLSSQEEKLVAGIHAIMSEDGVHPLIAEREYVRLIRNMVIEYGLLLLSILDKKSVTISEAGAARTHTASI
jgi:hypothetical protein